MCGIAGLICTAGADREVRLRRMADELVHRGPDDAGVWIDPDSGLGLAHRRLAVIDLSPQGHQPMFSASGRFVVAFNGEIYNYRALREKLNSEGLAPAWRGHSDTEVLLALIEAYGFESALAELNGMFAIAVADLQDKCLWLARDRMGEKPLYYGTTAKGFAFASELSAIRSLAPDSMNIDRNILAAYMRTGYVPAPWSIYQGVYKLEAGAMMRIPTGHATAIPSPTPAQQQRYFDIRDVAKSARKAQLVSESSETLDQLFESEFRRAVGIRMVSDVPLGAFLSGGYDSTAVVAAMQAQSSRPVKTFSIGFHEKAFDEAVYARQIASQLGTDHTELYVSPGQALQVVPDLPDIYSEPFADSSQIPTYLLCRMARGKVTVALSGDGGDELLAGYARYAWGERLDRFMRAFPGPVRRMAQWCLEFPNVPGASVVFEYVLSKLPVKAQRLFALQRFAKLASAVSGGPTGYYRMMMSHWPDTDSLVLGGHEPSTVVTRGLDRVPGTEAVEAMMMVDQLSYLPDDILVKVDRAAMAVSLETRIPLLDPGLVSLAWSLPFARKYQSGSGKKILKEMVHRYVPRELMERPKMGFGIPLDHWLRGPLREWAETLLAPDRIRAEGFLNASEVTVKWRQHLSGHYNWHYQLWNLLMFEAWLERQ